MGSGFGRKGTGAGTANSAIPAIPTIPAIPAQRIQGFGQGIGQGFGQNGGSLAGSRGNFSDRSPSGATPFGATPSGATPSKVGADDDMAAKREAFIAAERARGSGEWGKDEGGGYAGETEQTSPGLSHVSQNYRSKCSAPPERTIAMAYVWWFALGNISAHRFYLGSTQSACIQVGLLITSLALLLASAALSPIIFPVAATGFFFWAVWVFGDVFLIPRIHRAYQKGTRMSPIFS